MFDSVLNTALKSKDFQIRKSAFRMMEDNVLEYETLQRNSIIMIRMQRRVNPSFSWEVNIKSMHEELFSKVWESSLTLSWRRSLSYRNQSIDLHSKSMDRYLNNRHLGHERVSDLANILSIHSFYEFNYYCYYWYNRRTTLKNMLSLREKCPNIEFFLVRIFLYSDWIRRFTNLRI